MTPEDELRLKAFEIEREMRFEKSVWIDDALSAIERARQEEREHERAICAAIADEWQKLFGKDNAPFSVSSRILARRKRNDPRG